MDERKKESLFISYCWSDGNTYADELEEQLNDYFDVRRDKSQLIANVDAGYIETYLRECKITRNEDQKGMQLKYWVDSLFDEEKIDIVDFEQFLFNELFWGKRKYMPKEGGGMIYCI